MGEIVRGSLWFGLYLFLVLLPLATAVLANPNRTSPSPLIAIAIGAGFVGYSVMALEFALKTLKPGGDFLVKVFQGEGFDPYLAELRKSFKKVLVRKPQASRSRSREVYLLARGYNMV